VSTGSGGSVAAGGAATEAETAELGPASAPVLKPLAARLLSEAVQLVEHGGPGALSLREVQRRAGVSPAAAYRHFTDREALLLAVAQHCAGLLADHIAGALRAAPVPDGTQASARTRLLAGCRAYVDFATAHPGLYRAVFVSGEQLEELRSPSPLARGAAGDGGFNLLVCALDDVAAAAGADLGAWDPVAVWSCCHGLAMLRLDAALRGLPEETFEQARDSVLATITSAVSRG